MTYVRAVLWNWSRRDRLAVVLVAVTVAFLTATTLVLVATSARTTGVAAEYDAVGTVDRYATVDAAARAAGPRSLLLPVATVGGDGSRRVVGIPPPGERPAWASELGVASPPADGVARSGATADRATLRGADATITVSVHDRSGDAVLPAYWDVARPSLVERLGPTSALVLSPDAGAWAPDGGERTAGDERPADRGTPLRSALAFFRLGSQQVVGALALVAGGTALLAGVVVFGVVRMTARDRRRTVFVVRATGGTTRRVLGLFAVRGALLAAVGVALGYAVGVVATNLAVNVAVALGLPTSLSAQVTPAVARILAGAAVAVVGVAALAAPLAARPVAARLAGADARSTPRRPDGNDGRFARLRATVTPRLVALRTVVPVTASLWTFVVVALLLVAGASAAAPLSGGGTTIVEPGAVHPVASSVPAGYADAIETTGVEASAEILAFTVVDGEPAMVRGARYRAFAAVSNATLVAGERPSGPGEAVIGADLARTLDVERGTTVVLGGSTAPAVAPVEIVGAFAAPGPYDDSFVVPLATARHLTETPPGTVQFVRTTADPGTREAAANATVVSLSAPSVVPRGAETRVVATVVNPGSAAETVTVALRADGRPLAQRRVTVEPLGTTRVRLAHSFADVGARTVRVGSLDRRIRVVSRNALRIGGLAETVPVGSRPRITVETVTGAPVANATVSVADRTERTDGDGTARIAFSTAGARQVTVSAGGRLVRRDVTVSRNASRDLVGTVAVRPADPGPLIRPTARIGLANPWNATVTSRVLLRIDGVRANRAVSLARGERRTVGVPLDRRPPGTYSVELAVDGRVVGVATLTVDGSGRLAAAVATTDATVPASGLGSGVATVLGNLTVLAAVLAGLAGTLVVGSSAASLAGAVHGRRRTVGVLRATGAGPARVARVLVGDAVRLGVVATPLAVAGGLGTLSVLAAFDRLVFFGVRIHPRPDAATLAVVAAGTLTVVVVSGVAVTLGLVGAEPASLLGDDSAASRRDRRTDAGLGGEADD